METSVFTFLYRPCIVNVTIHTSLYSKCIKISCCLFCIICYFFNVFLCNRAYLNIRSDVCCSLLFFSHGTTMKKSVFDTFLCHPCILNVTTYILLCIATSTACIINSINQSITWERSER